MRKAITDKYTESVTVIERADWSIDFYDVETGRHYTRRVWYPVHGSDIYVQHRGGFYSIMTEFRSKYDPQAVSRYEAVSADELKSMTAEIIAHRAGKQHADNLTWEEVTRVYAYAVICNDADTEATMKATVNGILQNRDEQPDPDPAQIVAEAMNEATEATDDAREAERKTVEAAIEYDPETAAAFAAEARRAADKAEAAAKKAAAAARMTGASSLTCSTADIVSELAAIAREDADRATETAEQNARELEELKDTDAYAHSARAFADTAEYAEAHDDPEAARKCAELAREMADNAAASYEYSRHTCYADHQTSAYAALALEIRAEQVEDAKQAADRAEAAADRAEAAAERAEAIRKADDAAVSFCAAYIEATGEIPYADDAASVCKVARHDIARQLGSTRADRETVDAMVQAIAAEPEPEPAPIYQRHELEAFLGEPEDYDVEAIEAEATEYRDGARVWVAFGDDLAAIAERYQTAEYIPA